MNKINIILSTACAFAVINNSFGMLTKASSIKQITKTRFFHISTPTYDHQVYAKAQETLDKANINNGLLHKIIQQNEDNNKLLKENNLLLRTIAKQNYIYTDRDITFGNTKAFQENLKTWHYRDSSIKRHEDLLEHYYTLKQQYGIDVTQELE